MRGLRTKCQDLYSCVSDCEWDCVMLVETWLSSEVLSTEYFPNEYVVFRSDRNFNLVNKTCGGGVLLAFKSCFDVSLVDVSIASNALPIVDIIGCKISYNKTVMYIFNIYIPPSLSSADFEYFFDLLERVIADKCNVLVVGDFNVPNFTNINLNDAKSNIVNHFIAFSNFKQFNNILNVNNRLLDLVLSDIKCSVFKDENPLVVEDTYHPAFYIECIINQKHMPNFPKTNAMNAKTYNFKKANFIALYNSLLEVNWDFLNNTNNVNDACKQFYDKLYSLFDESVPVYRKKYYSYGYPVWYSSEIIENIKDKYKFHRLCKKYPHNEFYQSSFKSLRSSIKTQISRAYKKYLADIQSNFINDPKSFWKYVNNKKCKSRIPGKMYCGDIICDSPNSIVNGFAQFFSSVFTKNNIQTNINGHKYDISNTCLNISTINESDVAKSIKKLKNKFTSGPDKIPSFLVRDCVVLATPLSIIFNLALKTNTFPSCWKIARVCPVLKSGDPSLIENYRPISILSNFAKVFEMSLYTCIYPHIKHQLSPYQHGFMENRSTTSNLLSFTQYVVDVLDQQGQVDVVYTDFSKAFDRICHSIVLDKLYSFGFSQSLITFFTSYLKNRLQFVSYNDCQSDEYFSTSGVPQGSNLGPLLFLIFINDIADVIDCQKLLFADDLKLYNKINNMHDCLSLQENLYNVQVWCKKNNLHMNISKCKVVTYCRKNVPLLFNYKFDSLILSRCDLLRDLGVMFDSKLCFDHHISYIANSSFKTLGFIIRNTLSFNNANALKCLYFSLIRTKLEYCSIVWYPYYNVQKKQLEDIQRKFLKFLHFRIYGSYPVRGYSQSLLLATFSLHSLDLRRKLSSIRFLYLLCHNKIECSFLLSLLDFHVPRQASRYDKLFHLSRPRSNIRYKSPIYIMSSNFNNICSLCDLHFSTYQELLRVAIINFTENNEV